MNFWKRLALVGCFGLLLSAGAVGGDWMQGGTLHRSSLKEWVGASYDNRLATSADFFFSMSQKLDPDLLGQHVPTNEFRWRLHRYAKALEACVTKAEGGPTSLAAEAASRCYGVVVGD